jgi:hypothetical protein
MSAESNDGGKAAPESNTRDELAHIAAATDLFHRRCNERGLTTLAVILETAHQEALRLLRDVDRTAQE